MAFDDYEIWLHPVPEPPRITAFSKLPAGNFEGQVSGAEPGRNYVVEFTPNFSAWTAISTNTANPAGVFDFVDRNTAGATQRFYRIRSWP